MQAPQHRIYIGVDQPMMLLGRDQEERKALMMAMLER